MRAFLFFISVIENFVVNTFDTYFEEELRFICVDL